MSEITYDGLKKGGSRRTSAIATANLTSAQRRKYKNLDNPHYLKRLQKFHELQELREKNINYRRNILNRQKIANYRNELDRINGVLSQSIMKGGLTHEHLNDRKKQLKQMIENIN